jgi:hypothetical protein
MTGWRMRISRGAGPALCIAAMCFAAGASADRLPTNSELVGRALRSAADSIAAQLPLDRQTSIVILPSPGQGPDWAVENQIAGAIQTRAGRVSFHGALADTGHSTAPADSTQQAKKFESVVDNRPLDPSANILEYRIGQLGVRYSGEHKSRILGASRVDRVAQASVGVRLLSPQGHLIASAQGSSELADQVPQERLADLEDHLYQFPKPSLPTRDLARVLEPAIVIGLVSGLVFLFYTNRN